MKARFKEERKVPVVIKCGRCGYVFVEGKFEDVLRLMKDPESKTTRRMSMWELANEVYEKHKGVCPKCGKKLKIPDTIVITPFKNLKRKTS